MHPVSVVIPTYNGQKLLKKHLPAVLKSMRSGDELCIIDDASTDETVEWLLDFFTSGWEEKHTLHQRCFRSSTTVAKKKISLVVLANEKNQRYAASVNRAMSLAQNELVFLLNNDVSPKKDTIAQIVKYFEDHNEQNSVFAVGCLEYEGDTSKAPKGGKNKLWFEKGLFIHSRADDFDSGPTAWVSGGSGLFSRSKWLELGGFDLQFYPAYWEDVDLSYRAREAGWEVLFCADAAVFHVHESTNASVFKQKELEQLSWEHGIYFTQKHASFFQGLQHSFWKPYWAWRRRQS